MLLDCPSIHCMRRCSDKVGSYFTAYHTITLEVMTAMLIAALQVREVQDELFIPLGRIISRLNEILNTESFDGKL